MARFFLCSDNGTLTTDNGTRKFYFWVKTAL